MRRWCERAHTGDGKCLGELEELKVMELRGFHAGCDPWAMSSSEKCGTGSFSAASITLTSCGLPANFLAPCLCRELYIGAAGVAEGGFFVAGAS